MALSKHMIIKTSLSPSWPGVVQRLCNTFYAELRTMLPVSFSPQLLAIHSAAHTGQRADLVTPSVKGGHLNHSLTTRGPPAERQSRSSICHSNNSDLLTDHQGCCCLTTESTSSIDLVAYSFSGHKGSVNVLLLCAIWLAVRSYITTAGGTRMSMQNKPIYHSMLKTNATVLTYSCLSIPVSRNGHLL